MDVKKSKLNIAVSVSFKVITLIMVIIVRGVLIKICGNEVNGLNALYLSIIGFLSVAELGVGTAIIFSMYKPIVEGNLPKVSSLYHYYRKAYLLIGAIIFFSGVVLMPFLKFFAKDYRGVNANIYLTFVIMLISVVITYMFSAKISLINAYKNNYITTAISQSCIILQYILQILVLYIFRSFEAYLLCRILAESIQWIIIEIVCRKKYGNIIKNKAEIDQETTFELKKNIKAMFMHKIGYVLVNAVDGIVISAFVGVVALGEYSNYTTILSSMNGILLLVFTSLTSIVGHMFVIENIETSKLYCDAFHLLNFIIGMVFFMGYYAIIDNLIAFFFSAELVVSKDISAVIAINGFVQFMRRSILLFKDATGQFYGDRWKPLFEGICNIVLSILFVNLIGISGVIVATIITNILICHIVEPYVLFKNAFYMSPKQYYFRNYLMISIFIFSIFFYNKISLNINNNLLELLANGCLSVVISVVVCSLICIINKKTIISSIKLFREDKNE